jgi:hypothetical protein
MVVARKDDLAPMPNVCARGTPCVKTLVMMTHVGVAYPVGGIMLFPPLLLSSKALRVKTQSISWTSDGSACFRCHSHPEGIAFGNVSTFMSPLVILLTSGL